VQLDLADALLSSDGRARERALRRVDADNAPTLLPVALVRLNDWVPQVQAAAFEALEALVVPRLARVWLHALPTLEHLTRCGRTDRERLGALRRAVDELLLAGWHGGMVEEGLRSGDRAVRRASWRLALSIVPLDPAFADEASVDPDLVVRTMAFAHVGGDPHRARGFLADPAPSLRRAAVLRLVEARPEDWLEDLACAVSDRAAGVRHAAAYHLRGAGEDPLAAARGALPAAGALLALGELGGEPDVEVLLRHLEDPHPRVRAAALAALAQLAPTAATTPLNAALLRPGPERRVAVRVLATRPEDVHRALIDNLLDEGAGPSARAALRVARRLPHWSALSRLLRAAASPDEELSRLGATALRAWTRRFNHVATRPSPAEATAARVALADAAPRLQHDLVRELETQLELRT